MKDKTQKSFRGIVRILLLVFCYTFGSHAFALALEHEQTVDIYKVTDVPNPRNESSSNWVSNPNQILDESYVWEINNMLSQLEDSLSIEVTVVALPSIGEDIPAEFAHKLFEHWGIGKKADDNGLLILLVLDQRKVTFATGYGLEGVLPDALCFRIQQNEMVPWFRKNDFDRGITEGVRAVTLVLYGSDYEPVSQGTSDNYWKSASNTLWNFLANQPLMLWIFLIVSVSAILSCRPFFILIFLRCIKMKHYGFSRKSIWKNLETFPWSIESRLQLFFSRCLPRSAYHFWWYEFLDVQTGL